MKLSDIENLLGATHVGPDAAFDSMSIDTRTLKPGSLFVAIQGERVDGHDYIKTAFENGASAVLAQRPYSLEQTGLLVDDTVQALGQIAAYHRAQFNTPMIGVTGSCGKTTVKTMIGEILKQVGNPLITSGNYNNQIGVPLTLMNLNQAHDYAVIEMGASGQGDIDYVASIAQPDISVITNVHPAHLEGFGSVDGIAQAKAEIYQRLALTGTACVNKDSPYFEAWLSIIGEKKTLSFGLDKQADIQATQIKYEPKQTSFTLITPKGSQEVVLRVSGEHQVMNALASAACCYALGLGLEQVAKGLSEFGGVEGRLKRVSLENGLELIDDTYNSNPGSIESALKLLVHFPNQKIFVMGEMAELGEDSQRLHGEIGLLAKELGIHRLLGVGGLTKNTVDSFGHGATWFPDKDSLLAELKQIDRDASILIKGSRSAQMETVVQGMLNKEEA